MSDTPPPSPNPDQAALDALVVAAYGAYARSQQAEQRAYYESNSEAEYQETIAASEAEFSAAIKKIDTDAAAAEEPTPPQETE